MASLVHPTLRQVNQSVFPRLIFQLARPLNPVRVDIVIKNGDVYRPAEMYPAFGIRAK